MADITRRVQICLAANDRYREALGVVEVSSPTPQLFDRVTRRINRSGRGYRALRPIETHEAKLFGVLLNGTYLLQGYRNRDIPRQLEPSD